MAVVPGTYGECLRAKQSECTVFFSGVTALLLYALYLNSNLQTEYSKAFEQRLVRPQFHFETTVADENQHDKISAPIKKEKDSNSDSNMGDKKITDDTIANEEHTESKSVSPTETRSGKTDQHFLTSSNGNCDSQKHGKPVDEGNAQKKKKGTASLVKEDVLNPALEPVIAKKGYSASWKSSPLHLSVVACGNRSPQALVVLKSVVLFTASPLVFHIFADTPSQQYFDNQLRSWPAAYMDRVAYKIYNLTLPPGKKWRQNDWINLYKPCASQRLFLPKLLSDVDSLVYVDTDVVFVSPLERLWHVFSRFKPNQTSALAWEHEKECASWYPIHARHPYYGSFGVNSGVMLMNLTRIRQTKWLSEIMKIYKQYHQDIAFGDQDLLNIYFHLHPDQLYVLSCVWNYRPDYCAQWVLEGLSMACGPKDTCGQAEQRGVMAVHGSRQSMTSFRADYPAFSAVYDILRMYEFGNDMREELLERLKAILRASPDDDCAKREHIFTKQLEKFILRNESSEFTPNPS